MLGRVFDQIVSDRDDHVGLIDRRIDMVAPLQADGKQAVRIGAGHRAFAHEGIDDADPRLVRESLELLGGAFTYGTVARQDQRVLSGDDKFDGLQNRFVIGCGPARLVARHWGTVGIFLGNILR